MLNGRVCRCAKRARNCEHLVSFHQLSGLLHGFGGAVSIVEAEEFDFPAVDATLGVDHVVESCFYAACRCVSGRRTAVRHGLTELDLGISDTWVRSVCSSADKIGTNYD